jgi:LPS sulfotransferase NodH
MENQITKPIFIVGCPRSGTTILAKILNNHSQIASATEIHFFNHLCTLKKYDWTNLDEDFLKRFFNETRVEDFCSLLKLSFEEFKEQFEQTTIDTKLDQISQNQKRIFDTMMLILLKKKQKTFCCEKTPQHLLSVERILEIYKDAKIIHLIRDGRDTVNSLIKMPWRPEGLLNNSRFWKKYAKLGMEIKNKICHQTENYIDIKYEDLLLNPEESIKKLTNFIGVEFEETMLSNKLSNQKETNSNIFSSWESSWKHKAMEELDSTRVGAWQKELSEKDQTLLNWHLKKELAALGYETQESKLETSDKINIFSEYGSLFARRITKSLTDLIS